MYKFVSSDGSGAGPFGLEDLRRLAAAGEASPDSEVLDETTGSTHRLGDLLSRGVNYLPPAGVVCPKKSSLPTVAIVAILALMACVCLPIGAAILFPVFTQARQSATVTAKRGDMNTVAKALAAYATDHQGKMPEDMGTSSAVLNAIRPYMTQGEELKFLEDGPLEANHELSGKTLDGVENPSRTILMYYTSKKIDPYVIVLFCDYRVEKVYMMEFLDARNRNTYEMR